MKERVRNIVNSKRIMKVENILYSVIIFLLPLMNVNQGLDITDSTYSLGNYMFFKESDGTWLVSTYLSNVIGSIIVRLPYGDYLIGANVYTGLIVGTIAYISYLFFSRILGKRCAFVGEVVALCYCWIPTGILYNYLSYMFMVIGVILLYRAILSERRIIFLLAGLFLGLNVFVRIPNVLQMSFILALWVDAYMEKQSFSKVVQKTLFCVIGYLVGICVPIAMISVQYGVGNLGKTIQGLVGIAGGDSSYTPYSMIKDTIDAYIHSVKWLIVICGCIAVGMIVNSVKKGKYTRVKIIAYLAVIAIMLRFMWGRGMYSFRYYEDYSSMYEWGMMALMLSIIAMVYVFASKKYHRNIQLLAILALITIIIAPLGSNNYTYQNLNNLFLVMPIAVYIGIDFCKNTWLAKQNIYNTPISIMIAICMCCVVIQGFGFHSNFVFRDGTKGEKRDTKVESVMSLCGIYTNRDKAKNIEELARYIDSINPESAVYFGDCPGLAYVLRIPCAISSTWPDLDSYSIEEFYEELSMVKAPIIIRTDMGEYKNTKVKYDLLQKYIQENAYLSVFKNDEYEIYYTRKNTY